MPLVVVDCSNMPGVHVQGGTSGRPFFSQPPCTAFTPCWQVRSCWWKLPSP